MELYIAGTSTTTSYLYWGFLYILLDSEIQENIHTEIKEYLGLYFTMVQCS